MPRPSSLSELLTRLDSEFDALLGEVDRIDVAGLLAPGACGEWSVKDLLAHLDAWHDLFLTWEDAGRAGRAVSIPAPGFTWKQTPALNDVLWRRHRDDSLGEVLARLRASHARVRDVVAAYDEPDLFAKRRYPWTGSTSVGSYAVSATTSHYDWARKLIRRVRVDHER
jgi:hypothetical protein